MNPTYVNKAKSQHGNYLFHAVPMQLRRPVVLVATVASRHRYGTNGSFIMPFMQVTTLR